MKKYTSRILGLLAAVMLLYGCGYNSMQAMEEDVFKSWGDVESNLQRRSDLIPNLVETVKGYAGHEKETLQAVIEARAKATSVQLSTKDLATLRPCSKCSTPRADCLRPFRA